MNNNEKKQIVELLITIKSAFEYALENMNKSIEYIGLSYEGLQSIFNFFKLKEDNNFMDKIGKIIVEIEKFDSLSEEEKISFLKEGIKEVESLVEEVEKYRKIKALFLPYKASMWTSLESVWKAANEDKDCEAVVMPIPYHEIDSEENMSKLCYEGEEYPDYVPITKFWKYDISKEKPDMIFIHNPYDDANTLTRVPEEYYSRNLRKYTDELIYIPYYTIYCYSKLPNEPIFNINVPANYYADKIIVENDEVKKQFEKEEINRGKVVALGSPKFDAIYNARENSEKNKWKYAEVAKGKKVFLLITTLSVYVTETASIFRLMEELFNKIIKRNDSILIWRPHPLEQKWIENSIPELSGLYNEIREYFDKYPNTFLDLSAEYTSTLLNADGIFSTGSSLVNEIEAMGKPLYLISKSPESYNQKHLIDNSYIYYFEEKDMDEYIEDVVSGKENELYSKRIEAFNNSVHNAKDGSSGKHVYEMVKRDILNKK